MDGEDLDQATRRAIAEAAERFRAESAARNQPQPPRGFTAEVNQEVAAAGGALRRAGYDPNTAVDVDPADLSSSGLTPEIGSMSSTPRSGTDPFARPAPAGASDAPFQRGAFEPRAFGSEIPEPRPIPTPTPAPALEPTPEPTPALTPAPAPAQAVPDARFERQEVEVPAETQSRHTTSETTQQEQAAPDQADQTLDQSLEQTPEPTQAPKLNH